MTPLWKKNNIQVVALEILMVKLGTLLNIKKKNSLGTNNSFVRFNPNIF